MAITIVDWLVTSDVACEAAFRVDLLEDGRGKWIVSYLPTHRRVTRDQAVTAVVLAETILTSRLDTDELARETAQLQAAELGLTLIEVICLLAVRGRVRCRRRVSRVRGGPFEQRAG